MKQKNSTKILIILSLVIFLFGSGYKLGEYKANKQKLGLDNSTSATSQATINEFDFNLFWDVWNKVVNKYVDKKKIDLKKMFYGSVKGMVSSLNDHYTFFLTPEENTESKKDLEGKFSGIGAQLGMKDNQVIVIAPIKDSPAEKAGIMAGDIIIKVDGQSTKEWTLLQTVSKIRGTKGTKVEITIQRKSKEHKFKITRDEILVDSVEFKLEKESQCKENCKEIAYIKINQFGENTNSEWDKAVNKVLENYQNKKISNLVLDLRDNPGGFLESSVYIASEFLKRNQLVVKQESTTSENKEYYVTKEGKLQQISTIVLINQGSASASEILAGALKSYNRAKLIGEKSFGKGSVQEALDLKKGAGLHITVAKWILPNGEWINGKGIEPNIKIKNNIKEGNTLTRETDLQLEKAIKLLLE